jgi:hypothetical protein
MGVIGWWVSRDPAWKTVGDDLYKIGLLCGGIAASVVFYIGAMWLLKSEELQFLWSVMKRKKKRDGGQRPAAGEDEMAGM